MANPHAGWRAGVVAGSLGVALGCGAAAPSKPVSSSAAPSTAHEAASAPTGARTAEPRAHEHTSDASTPSAAELGSDEPPASPEEHGSVPSVAAKVAPSPIEAECSALCANAAETCSRKSARECRANCGKYESLGDRCQVQVLGAIRCQAAIPKFVCSNLASECTAEFQALAACEQGELSSQPPISSDLALPTGWTRVRDTEAGFEVALPPGASVGDLDGHRTWTADAPDGANYRVVVLPPLRGAATEKLLMAAILDYLGHKCQPAVRLHGRFETDRDIAERFNARCEDGKRWRGLMRASSEQLVLILEVLPPGAKAAGDRYYYSFQYLQ